MDRRRSSRFQLRLPVLTKWADGKGQSHYGGGFSRDISLRGVFVMSSEPPPEATMISVTVVLPNVREGSQELQLQSVGSVVRVEQSGAITGYAIDCHFSGIEDLVE